MPGIQDPARFYHHHFYGLLSGGFVLNAFWHYVHFPRIDEHMSVTKIDTQRGKTVHANAGVGPGIPLKVRRYKQDGSILAFARP